MARWIPVIGWGMLAADVGALGYCLYECIRGLEPPDEFSGFDFNFEISARLPESRTFEVRNNRVTIGCNADYIENSFYEPKNKYYITLIKEVYGIDDRMKTYTFKTGEYQEFTWGGLENGVYYFEISKDNQKAFMGYERDRGNWSCQTIGHLTNIRFCVKNTV